MNLQWGITTRRRRRARYVRRSVNKKLFPFYKLRANGFFALVKPRQPILTTILPTMPLASMRALAFGSSSKL